MKNHLNTFNSAPTDRFTNLDAEKGVLASCIIDGGEDTIEDCIAKGVTPETFFKREHQIMFEGMLALRKKLQPIDEVVLASHLRDVGTLDEAGGIVAINEMTSLIETTMHASHWIEVIKLCAKGRNLVRALIQGAQAAQETPLDEIPTAIDSIQTKLSAIIEGEDADTESPASEVFMDVLKEYRAIKEGDRSLATIKTGYAGLDRLLCMDAGRMTIVAARPGVGKSLFAQNVGDYNALRGHGVDVRLHEMTRVQWCRRSLSCHAEVAYLAIANGNAMERSEGRLARSAETLMKAPIYYDDATLTIGEIRARARRARRKIMPATGKPLDTQLLIVDYLQLVKGTQGIPRQEQVAEISRGLKSLAKELNIHVLALCQLNRDSEKENRDPRLSDMRESGAIEQDADAVVFLKRHNDDDDIIRVIVTKQRDGPVGEVQLKHERNICKLVEYTSEPEQQYVPPKEPREPEYEWIQHSLNDDFNDD